MQGEFVSDTFSGKRIGLAEVDERQEARQGKAVGHFF